MNKSRVLTHITVLSKITAISTNKDLKSISNEAKQTRKIISGLHWKKIYKN